IHYVGRVLPSLGVEGVRVTTFARFARRIVETLFPKMPTKLTEETPPVVSRAKSHPAMIRAIDVVVARVARAMDARIPEAMGKWPQGEDVVRAWEKALPNATPDARLSALAQWLAGKRGIDGAPNAGALPQVTKSALEQLGHELRASTRSVAAV